MLTRPVARPQNSALPFANVRACEFASCLSCSRCCPGPALAAPAASPPPKKPASSSTMPSRSCSPGRRCGTRRLGQVHLHHRRHRDPRGQARRARHRRHRGLRQAVHALRRPRRSTRSPARKIKLLKLSLTIATPADPKESEELTRIAAGMEGTYGKGKYCPGGPAELPGPRGPQQDHGREPRSPSSCSTPGAAGTPSRGPCARTSCATWSWPTRARASSGFADNGAMWRSKYDMPPDAFAKELDRLWEQVRPLYLSLHAYVRSRLREKYGDAVPGQRADSRAPAGQHVGAGLGQHLSAGGAAERRSGLRPDRAPQEAQHRLEADGEVRRGLLHLAGLRRRCRRPSGSARCSSSRATARWCATPAPGTSTTSTTCG